MVYNGKPIKIDDFLGYPRFRKPPYVIILSYWVDYNDLTVLPHWKRWLIREIIPNGRKVQVSEIL
jgi:hypothetical protein